MSTDTETQPTLPPFSALGLAPPVLKALDEVGYETPSPIQAQIIPHVLAGKDVLGQAQTGTGKTAAFALPLLSNIDLKQTTPQVLVLAPTRELAIQVSEAFQKYAAQLKGFHVLPIYGGQDYRGQLRQLKRGAHVVVGTPGRVMDHMRRGTLKLDNLKCLVLDEADEMLRMGFIDDVEWILEQTPDTRQIALFSATMPKEVKRIAQQHLQDPEEVTIKMKTSTASTIRQRVWMVSGLHKLDALTRILEAEAFDGMIIFSRTKLMTVELADKLQARGYSAAALNGDMQQKQRERTVDQLKKGQLDILVATDVAARGLDVERISHVINYDIPYDTEAYIHRIGRTGRAGRTGDAILFVAHREKRLLKAIERATKQPITVMEPPTPEAINELRIAQFKQRITDTLAKGEELGFFSQLVTQYQQEHDVTPEDIATALAKIAQGDKPLLLKKDPPKAKQKNRDKTRDRNQDRGQDRQRDGKPARSKRPPAATATEEGMERYRIEVGHNHSVKPGNIVGAIANEAGLDSQYIGRIDIQESYSTVDLPDGMPKEVFRDLKKVWVAGQQLQISKFDGNTKPGTQAPKKAGKRASNAGDKKPRKRKQD